MQFEIDVKLLPTQPIASEPKEKLRHHKLLQLFVKHTPAAVAMCDPADAILVL